MQQILGQKKAQGCRLFEMDVSCECFVVVLLLRESELFERLHSQGDVVRCVPDQGL